MFGICILTYIRLYAKMIKRRFCILHMQGHSTAAGKCWLLIKLKPSTQTSKQHKRDSLCLQQPASQTIQYIYTHPHSTQSKPIICSVHSHLNKLKKPLPGNHILQFRLGSGSTLHLCVCDMGLMNSPVMAASSGRLIK